MSRYQHVKRGRVIVMAITLKEIAQRDGVSAATVSFTLRGQRIGRPPLSNDTILCIQKIAGQLGYRPSHLANSLLNNRTNTLGVLLSNLSFGAEELLDSIKNVILPIEVKLRLTIGSIAEQ